MIAVKGNLLVKSITVHQKTCLFCFTAERQLEDDANQETTSKKTKADMNNSARDSGCHMPSDSPDNNTEDTDPHFIAVYPLSTEIKAS